MSTKKLLIFITSFIVLMGIAAFAPQNVIDLGIANIMHMIQNPIFTIVLGAITYISEPAVTIIIIVGMAGIFIARKQIRKSVWVLGTMGGGVVLATIIKTVIARPRPIHQIFAETGYSFPSIHTLSATVLVLILVTLFYKNVQHNRNLRLLAIIWIPIVAFSRVYLGAHYLTDVLGGFTLGVIVYQLASWIEPILYQKFMTIRGKTDDN